MARRKQAPQPQAPQTSGTTAPPSRGRLWLFRIAALLGAPLLLLLLAEGVLRLTGFGYPPSFLLPVPERQEVWTTNPRYGWRFFPRPLARTPVPLEVEGTDPGDRYRIFVVGGSAAQGTPDAAYSFGRALQALLETRYPDADFEVHNAAMTAASSHVVLPIVRDLERFHPDAVLVYLGNNEVVGPYGAGTVFRAFSPNLTAIRAGIALRRFRFGQLVDRVTSGGDRDAGRWRGMEMFLEQRVAADDPRLEDVYRHFEDNLSEIVAHAAAAGAHTLLATVATNLRHPPFASLHRPDLGEEELERWQEHFDAGLAAVADGRHQEAVASFEAAAEIDDAPAELHYNLGLALARLGRFEEAEERLVRARDLDALRFRADTRINDVVRRVAEAQAELGAVLVDAAADLAGISPAGLPGSELFYEHVHLRFAGNDALARSFYRQLEPLLPERITGGDGEGGAGGALPPPERVAERLALTPFDELDLERSALEIISRPPFTGLRGHAASIERARRSLAERRAALGAGVFEASREIYRQQLESHPRDLHLRRRFARLLQEGGRAEEAAEEWAKLLERLPGVTEWRGELGLALADAGRVDEAVAELRRAIEEAPGSAELHTNLGAVHEKAERYEAAIAEYRRAIELEPGDPLAAYNLATAELRRGEPERAAELYRELIAEHPDFAPAHHNLGHVLEEQGDADGAIEQYRKAIELRPDLAEAHNSLGLALEAREKLDEAARQYLAAIAYDPSFALAHFNLADLLFSHGRAAEAAEAYRRGLRHQPDNLQARYNLAGSLQVTGRWAEAAEEFQRVLDRDPEHAGALNNLAWILATAEAPELRDPERAVALAERAADATNREAPEILDTLATTYLSAGRRADAVATLEEALGVAREAGKDRLVAAFEARLRGLEADRSG
jgi:tetratricopeptide (TPR) repeat protein